MEGFENEIMDQEDVQPVPIYGEYATQVGRMVVIRVDDLSVCLTQPDITHERIVEKLNGAKGEVSGFDAERWQMKADMVASITLGEEFDALSYAKRQKAVDISEYDASVEVNSFYIGGQAMWLTVEERQQLATQISANEAVGRTEMTKWFGGHSFTFPIATWRQMLTALEVYAGDALNVTEGHKAAVNALSTIEEVKAYDVTLGYSEKLSF